MKRTLTLLLCLSFIVCHPFAVARAADTAVLDESLVELVETEEEEINTFSFAMTQEPSEFVFASETSIKERYVPIEVEGTTAMFDQFPDADTLADIRENTVEAGITKIFHVNGEVFVVIMYDETMDVSLTEDKTDFVITASESLAQDSEMVAATPDVATSKKNIFDIYWRVQSGQDAGTMRNVVRINASVTYDNPSGLQNSGWTASYPYNDGMHYDWLAWQTVWHPKNIKNSNIHSYAIDIYENGFYMNMTYWWSATYANNNITWAFELY